MRNLKKILSLALALVMVFSLMTFVSAREFNDAADIEHSEAVEVMSSLGVINGMGGNMFNPKGNVTRGEMAKMITYISLGNVEPTAFLGTTTNLTDINGHWAEAYIKYCYSQGIISGRGNGIFDPNASVTATEAARMLLVAIGYNADVQVYTGSQWNINVVRDAQLSHLYDDVSVTSTEVLNRDKAAQMMYNALNANTIVKSSQVDRVTGDITDIYTANGPTLLAKSYEAKVWIGAFTGNEKSGATSLVDGIQVYGKLEDADENDSDSSANFVYDYDIANIGEEVKVIFKDGTGGTKGKPDKNDTIYGVYKTGKTEVVTATVNDIKDGADAPSANNKIKVGSTEYKVAVPKSGDVIIEKNYDSSTDVSGKTTAAAAKAAFEGLKDAQNGDTVKFILNDNSEIISAYVTETRISYVTAINGSKITLNGVGTIDMDDNDIYANAAKNDVVTYSKLYSTNKDDAYFIVALAESISGTMTGYKYASSKYESLSVDGTAYKTFKKTPLSATINSEQTVTTFSGDDIDEDFTLYLVNGYVGYVMRSSDSANKYALVTNANTGKLGSTFDEPKAELLLADGTKVTAVLDKKSVIYNGANYANNGSQLPDNGSASAKISNGDGTGALENGQLVRYSVTSDNTYKIIEVLSSDGNYGCNYTLSQTGKLYDDDLKCVYQTAGDLSTDVVTSGDCVVFLKNTSDNSYKVYKIRDLKDITVSSATIGVLTKDGKAVAIYSELAGRPSGASSDRTYGIVSSYNGTTKVSGDSYYSWTVQNDQGEYTVLMDTTTKIGTGTGKLISFEAVSDNIYNDGDITVYDGTNFADATKGLATWVKEYNESDKTITYWNTVTKISTDEFVGSSPKTVALDDDCVIVYVNSDDKKGGDNVGISEFDTSTGYRNVILVKDDNSSKVVAILVESSRDKDILREDGTSAPVVPPVVDLPEDKKDIPANGTTNTVAYTLSAGTPSAANEGTVSFTLTPASAVTNANGDKITIAYTVSTPAARAAVADGNYTKDVIVPNGSSAPVTVEITGVAGKKVTITSVTTAAAPAPAEPDATADMALALTTPAVDENNTITGGGATKTVAVNVAANTESVVITGTKTAAQTVAIGGTDVADVTAAGTDTAPTYTVDTSGIKTGGSKTFTLKVSETGKSDITYTVTVTVKNAAASTVKNVLGEITIPAAVNALEVTGVDVKDSKGTVVAKDGELAAGDYTIEVSLKDATVTAATKVTLSGATAKDGTNAVATGVTTADSSATPSAYTVAAEAISSAKITFTITVAAASGNTDTTITPVIALANA